MTTTHHPISTLVWDFDGTFYKPQPALWSAIHEAEYQTIMNHTGWTREKTILEFEKIHTIIFPSGTQTVAQITGLSISEATMEFEGYFDRRKFLDPDPKLQLLFSELEHYTHYILANGAYVGISNTLNHLGLKTHIFKEIITSETVGVTKPDLAGYRYIMRKTGLPPESHLMIGDRETVDLEPAHMVGMKTCLVWSDIPSIHADYTLPVVYDVPKLFI